MNPHVLEALQFAESLPEVHWLQGDDLCDCTFQRIGSWTNPYLGATLRVRLCCIWAELYKQYPQFVQEIPAFWNDNTFEWEGMREWDSDEMDMPKPIWHRVYARKHGVTVTAARDLLRQRDQMRPKKVPPKSIAQAKASTPTSAELERSLQKRLRATGWL